MTSQTLHQAAVRRRLKALAERSDLKGGLRLAGHGLTLCASSLLVAFADYPWLPAALALHGVLLVFLFAPLHECLHRTAFRSRWLNGVVAWLCGFILLLPPSWFRAYHLAHHRFTQDPARDPELAGGRIVTWRAYLWHLTGIPYWRDAVRNLLTHARGRTPESFVADSLRGRVVGEARLFLAGYAAIAAAALVIGSAAPLVYWIVPLLVGQPFLRFYLLAEHGACPLVPDMFRNSRTTRSTALVRWLAWNMPYHAEHHAYPALPFHALSAAHRLLRRRDATLASGYLSAHRAITARLG